MRFTRGSAFLEARRDLGKGLREALRRECSTDLVLESFLICSALTSLSSYYSIKVLSSFRFLSFLRIFVISLLDLALSYLLFISNLYF